MSNDSKSLYRNRRFISSSDLTRLDWLLEAPGPHQPRLDEAVVFSGALSPSAEVLFSHHVVGGTIILPGVGYVEMAFAARTWPRRQVRFAMYAAYRSAGDCERERHWIIEFCHVLCRDSCEY
jgi:hypothetical protein